MFSRELLQDSYTLDNYIHLVQKDQQIDEIQQQIHYEDIQKMQYSTKKRKNSTQLSIFSWLVKDKPIQSSLLVSLDKELILKIYSYMRISQTVIVSQVCSYLSSCYKHLWTNLNFFQKFQTDKFSSQELSKVIQKSKLQHIRQLKHIYMGKNIRKNRQKIKMRITDGNKSGNTMLQIFSISPKVRNGIVFIMDSHLDGILNTSYKGLRCIQLNRCPYIKNILGISRCLQLQKFSISYNQHVTYQTLQPIFKRCLKLQTLQISQCKNLDENVFKQLRNICQLRHLTLKSFRQSFGMLTLLGSCQNLQHLNIDDSLINDDQFICGIREIKGLKYLSIQGCALLTNISIDYLARYIDESSNLLKQIQIARVPNIDCSKIQTVKEKLFKKNLQTLS